MAYGNVNTGDVLLFSSNIISNRVLKFFTSSQWSHIGIAVRINKNGKVSKNINDTLYVLEINTRCKYDSILKDYTAGVFFTKAKILFPFYNKINCRKLKNKYRTENFLNNIMNFAKECKNIRFPSTCLPLLGAWLGINIKNKPLELICSAFVAKFYLSCLDNKITFDELMGDKLVISKKVCKPEHFSALNSPNSIYFKSKDLDLIINREDTISILFFPLIISFFVLIVILMTI